VTPRSLHATSASNATVTISVFRCVIDRWTPQHQHFPNALHFGGIDARADLIGKRRAALAIQRLDADFYQLMRSQRPIDLSHNRIRQRGVADANGGLEGVGSRLEMLAFTRRQSDRHHSILPAPRYDAWIRYLSLIVVLLGLGAGATEQAESPARWPRFRGPDSNPVSDHPNLPVTWSKTDNVEWVADVPGVGWSSPVVWGSRVFLTAATSEQKMKPPSLGTEFSNDYIAELRKQGLSGEELNKRLWARDREMPDDIVISLMVFCFDLETGKRLWERQIYHGRPKGGRHVKNSFASETPVTDGQRVYAYFTDYGLFAFDFNGTPVWATPFERRPTVRDYGTGASPALYRDRLFVLNDNEEQGFLAAFDARSGKELWRTPRTVTPARKTGWSTPYVWENKLRTEVVTVGPAVAISYDLDGRELWRINRMGAVAIQSPFAWNDILFLTSGTSGDDNKPIVAVRAGGAGDITPSEPANKNDHVLWYERIAGGTYLPTPVIYRNGLYVLHATGIFSRHNVETGERVFRSRVAPGAAAFTASPWAYDGKIFLLSEEGNTYVVEAADQYRLLGVNSLDEFALATPAIVGDRLLIRTHSRLYSIRNRR
jgi:outer membrane protein assembly factor BamB